MKIDITTPEALELVQYHNPQYWKSDIMKPVAQLMKFGKLHQLSHKAALRAMTVIKSNMANNIYLMAAYQYIMEQKVKEYNEVTEQIHQYNTQLMHLNGGPDSKERKEELRKHYMQKLLHLDARRKELLSDREVVMALNVKCEAVNPQPHEKA